MKKRVLAVLLSACMLAAAVPYPVLAADTEAASTEEIGTEAAAEEEPFSEEETEEKESEKETESAQEESSELSEESEEEQVESEEKTEDVETESVAEERKVASTATEGNFEYTEDDNGITITKYTGSESEVVIPEQIDGKDVVAIGESAFFNCNSLINITIPNSVTSIGNEAFYSCIVLTNVTIPNSVTSIGDKAFGECYALTSITIPNSVASIGKYAFAGCRGLTSITIPDSVTSIDSYTFYVCSSLTSIIIPDSVTGIGEAAFAGCRGLTSITIPNSVTNIGSDAFEYCSRLTTINIPENVTSIGKFAFECSGLTSITIPDSVIYIGSGAFSGCSSLTSITIPDSVERIEVDTFSGCSSLTNITIPDSVTSIGNSAFKYCSSLTTINIPESITSIENYAFYECSSLTNITIPDSVTSIGNSVFAYCSGLTTIKIPESVTNIEQGTFEYSSLTSISIPTSVTCIEWEAFNGCTSLKDVYYTSTEAQWKKISIGSSNECLTNATIHYNSSSTINSEGDFEYTIENNEVTITKYTGSENKVSIPSEIVSKKVVSIGKGAFSKCTSITSVIIPDGVTTIGNSAFQDCTGLTSITIPVSVAEIDAGAFDGCTALKDVYYNGTESQWKDISVAERNTCLTNAAIHYGSTESGNDTGNDTDDDASEKEYINAHVKFVNSDVYSPSAINNFNLSKAFEWENLDDLEGQYKAWSIGRMKVFDNPYEVALADLVNSKEVTSELKESFTLKYASDRISIINDVISLINEDGSLKPDEMSKVEKFLRSDNDYSDKNTYKLLEKALKNVDEKKLQKIFFAIDTTGTSIDIAKMTKDTVEALIETVNYTSTLKAYQQTSSDFKVILVQMMNWAQKDNEKKLVKAINTYINADDNKGIAKAVLKKVVSEGIDVAPDINGLFDICSIEKTVSWLKKTLNLTGVSAATASAVGSVLAGCKIGYDIGTSVDNLLFNSDDTSSAYLTAYASAKVGKYLTDALEDNAGSLRKEQTDSTARLFCANFGLYKKTQINIAARVINFFAENDKSRVNKIFKNQTWTTAIHRWQVYQSKWKNVNCHGSTGTFDGTGKEIVIGCPVDVTIKDSSGKTVLTIAGTKIDADETAATAVIRNGIKYICVPEGDYQVQITAIDNGTMSYSVVSFDSDFNEANTVNYEDIKLKKGASYSGTISKDKAMKVDDYALTSGGSKVDSRSVSFEAGSKVAVKSLTMDKDQLTMDPGDKEQLTAAIAPEDASVQTVTWYSEDDRIAAVDEYGNVTAKNAGTTTIHCETLDGNITASCSVTVTGDAAGKDLSNAKLVITPTEMKYDGNAQKPEISVKINDTALTEGTDYQVMYDNNTSIGKATVTAKGIGDYTGEISGSFDITAKFSDVADPNHSYFNSIYWAASKGITTGYSDGTFGIGKNCSRGAFVTFLWRQQGSPDPTLTAEKSGLKDFDSIGKSYQKAVLWAVENGITTGYKDKTFRAGANVTRGAAVTFLYRAAGEPKVSITRNDVTFTDMVPEGSSYETGILWAVENKITTGYSNNTFRSGNNCTRGATVTFLQRFDNLD